MDFYSITTYGYQKQNISALPPPGKWIMTSGGIIVVNDPFDEVVDTTRVKGVVHDIVSTTEFVILEILSYDIDANPHFHRLIKGDNYELLDGDEKTIIVTNPIFPKQAIFYCHDTQKLSHYHDHIYTTYDNVSITKIDSIAIGPTGFCYLDDVIDKIMCEGDVNGYNKMDHMLKNVGDKKVNICSYDSNHMFTFIGDELFKIHSKRRYPTILRIEGTTYDFIDCCGNRMVFGTNSNKVYIWNKKRISDRIEVPTDGERVSNARGVGLRDGDKFYLIHDDDDFHVTSNTTISGDGQLFATDNMMGVFNGSTLDIFNFDDDNFKTFHDVNWIKYNKYSNIIAYQQDINLKFYNSEFNTTAQEHISNNTVNGVVDGLNGFMIALTQGDALTTYNNIRYVDDPNDFLIFTISTSLCGLFVILIALIRLYVKKYMY